MEIIEIKTGGKQKHHAFQLAAQAHLVTEGKASEFEFNPEAHQFTFKGKKCPSITQVLALIDHNRGFYTGDAADRGTWIHARCMEIAMGQDDAQWWRWVKDHTAEETGYLRAFKDFDDKFLKGVDRNLLQIEDPLFSTRYKFGGIPDIINCQGDERKLKLTNLYLYPDGHFEIVDRTKDWKVNFELFKSLLVAHTLGAKSLWETGFNFDEITEMEEVMGIIDKIINSNGMILLEPIKVKSGVKDITKLLKQIKGE
jgi:hypothetical protein